VVEAKFCFFQMERKSVLVDAVKFGQPMLGVSPEALDAIDAVGTKSKLIVAVMDAMMAFSVLLFTSGITFV
jgi:hypothetical protein